MREPENSGQSIYNRQAPLNAGAGPNNYIGVPDDWPEKQAAMGNVKHGPLDPNQFTSVGGFNWVRTPYSEDAELGLVTRSPAEITQFQTWARRVGLIGPNTRVTGGMADQPTIAAFRELLGFANVNGLSMEEAQAKYTTAIQADPANPKRVFDPPERRKASVKDLRQVVRATAMDIMGEEPSEEQINRIVAQYRQGEETQYQGTLSAAREGFEVERYYNDERAAPKTSAQTIEEAPGVDSLATEDFLGSDPALKWSLAQGALGIIRTLRGG